MIIVKPGQELTQVRGEVVIYQLKFEDWCTDLVKPDGKNARITSKLTAGSTPLNMKVLPYETGKQMRQISITSQATARSEHEVTFTVKSEDEVRIRSFALRIVQ